MDTSDIVSLAEIKAHLNITDNDDDTLLTDALEAARRHVEAWCGSFDEIEGAAPQDLVEALKQLAGHFYENREATFTGQGSVSEVPFGFHDLIGPHRKWEF
ncbi:head-tail connector protein [Ancylobacter vacuolatus]|uniref:Phage gp6-like head-tail connector protein n=1 Tax=Ancylobacter vacuolatus TaxID=223389 RepID=A0ABU0DHF4_9HYPH|nr:head-tail connector protein [Ancylobacter vacuolatus]MDQ0347858.1 hypothetical protein [Ancylobacter vacuolatus]